MASESFPGEYDVCNTCETVFRRSTMPPCASCKHVHRGDEWCFLTAPAMYGADGMPISQRGLASIVHGSIFLLATTQGLQGRWAWTLDPKASIVVGIHEDMRRNRVRFWVRDTERCNVRVCRSSLLNMVIGRVRAAIYVEMIDSPTVH